MKLFVTGLIGVITIQLSHAAVDLDRAWMRISDPLIMSSTFNRHFSSLPLTAQVSDTQKFWSSDYWARNKGGINYRWNAPRPSGFNLISPTKNEAASMSISQLSTLAPSEKYDLLIGRYDYPLKTEVAGYARSGSASWEGICDGWAGAALNHHEPKPIVLTNPDGIKIPFGSSDIKGILSWYYARKFAGANSQMGRRCNGSSTSTSENCADDMNAGAFHIVLTNKIGLEGNGFIADIDRGSQVWNHLPHHYTSTIRNMNLPPLSSSAPGTVNMIRVRTIVSYVYLLTRNSWTPVIGTSGQRYTNRTYDYYLDLDSSGNIIGGDWISNQRPDFLWLDRKSTTFTGIYSRLPELLND
jgi:hypothetical protein